MLGLNQSTEDALLIMKLLAQYQKPMSASKIAKQANLSLPMTRKMLRMLKSTPWLMSYPGTQGGYTLSTPLSRISLKSFIEHLDGQLAIVPCLSGTHVCDKKAHCEMQFAWKKIASQIAVTLEQYRIADLFPSLSYRRSQNAHV